MRKSKIRLLAAAALVAMLLPVTVHGDTATDEFDRCLNEAIERADERAANGEETRFLRFIAFNMDVATCVASYLSPF